jgi:hypothetical protein
MHDALSIHRIAAHEHSHRSLGLRRFQLCRAALSRSVRKCGCRLPQDLCEFLMHDRPGDGIAQQLGYTRGVTSKPGERVCKTDPAMRLATAAISAAFLS